MIYLSTLSTTGACISKIPKLFGRILCDIVLFVCSQGRRLDARNFAVILFFTPFKTLKDQLYRVSRSEFYEWPFGPEKFSELSRNVPLNSVCFSFLDCFSVRTADANKIMAADRDAIVLAGDAPTSAV